MNDIEQARKIAASAADERGQTTLASMIRSGDVDDNPAVQTALDTGKAIEAAPDIDHSEPVEPPPSLVHLGDNVPNAGGKLGE